MYINLVPSCKESFSNGRMIDVGLSWNGKFQIRKSGGNIKINATYYQEKFLRPIFTEEILFFKSPNGIPREILLKLTSHTLKNTTTPLEFSMLWP